MMFIQASNIWGIFHRSSLSTFSITISTPGSASLMYLIKRITLSSFSLFPLKLSTHFPSSLISVSLIQSSVQVFILLSPASSLPQSSSEIPIPTSQNFTKFSTTVESLKFILCSSISIVKRRGSISYFFKRPSSLLKYSDDSSSSPRTFTEK